jgi:hypothetical protein
VGEKAEVVVSIQLSIEYIAARQASNAPKDEFGVMHTNILYNKEENKAFCILDTPSQRILPLALPSCR